MSDNGFKIFESGSAPGSVRVYRYALAAFAEFLPTVGVETGDLLEPESWKAVKADHIAQFRTYLLSKGSKPNTVSSFVSIVRIYAEIAAYAGHFDQREYVAMSQARRTHPASSYITA